LVLLTILQKLDLRSNNLIGTVPIEIANLIFLHSLELHWNNLTGSIPSELGLLTVLTRLTGIISTQFGELTKLNFLDFGDSDCSPS
jgi:hypothetical protein